MSYACDYIFVRRHLSVCPSIRLSVCLSPSVCACVYVCMYVSMYLCMHVYVYYMYACVCIHRVLVTVYKYTSILMLMCFGISTCRFIRPTIDPSSFMCCYTRRMDRQRKQTYAQKVASLYARPEN